MPAIEKVIPPTTELYEEIPNFLDQKYFDHLYAIINQGKSQFYWNFQEEVAYKGDVSPDSKDAFYFIHPVFNELGPQSGFHKELQPLYEQLGVRALLRTRVIMYVNQGRFMVHSPHIDYNYPHSAALLYMNTCNGYTLLADEHVNIQASQSVIDSKDHKSPTSLEFKREDNNQLPFQDQNKSMSVANKMTIHDGSRPHCSTTTTDQKKRILIAINYF